MSSPLSSLPSRMIAIGIKAPGGPETLVPEERAVPAPGDGEILVKVAAAGVNRPDVMQRKGLYPPPKGAPDIPGLEIAGDVVAIGNGVTRWKLGDKVMALVVGGGYAAILPRTRKSCAARSRQSSDGASGRHSGDLLHGLAQCVRARRAQIRRDIPRAWRIVRHRHDRDPAREGFWRARLHHGRLGRKMRGLPQARRRCRN